jgi:hypothetical protein
MAYGLCRGIGLLCALRKNTPHGPLDAIRIRCHNYSDRYLAAVGFCPLTLILSPTVAAVAVRLHSRRAELVAL